MVLSESMSYGLQIIGSRIVGLEEIVEDGITEFLFEPGNSEKRESKMEILLENLDFCQHRGQAG